MKKYVLIVIAVLLTSPLFSQLVHVDGSRTINIAGGITNQGVGFHIGHSRYSTRNFFTDYNLGYEQGNLSVKNLSGQSIDNVSSYYDIEVNAKVNYSLFRWGNFYVNPAGGIFLAFEKETSAFDNTLTSQAFGGGFLLGANVEYWNLGDFGFKAGFDQYLRIKSLLGNKFNIYLSVMYNL